MTFFNNNCLSNWFFIKIYIYSYAIGNNCHHRGQPINSPTAGHGLVECWLGIKPWVLTTTGI